MIRSLVFFFVVADARWMERRTQHYCQHKSSLWTKDLCRRVFVFSFFYCCSFRSTFCMAFVGKYSHQTMCNTKSIEGSEIIVNYILFLTFRIRIMNAFSIHLKNRRRKKKATIQQFFFRFIVFAVAVICLLCKVSYLLLPTFVFLLHSLNFFYLPFLSSPLCLHFIWNFFSFSHFCSMNNRKKMVLPLQSSMCLTWIDYSIFALFAGTKWLFVHV